MKMTKKAMFAAVFVVSAHAFGAGFGLYEMSARSMMSGGHNVGRAIDASAVYYNPAMISDLTGTWVTVGMTMINPPLDTRVNGVGTHKMNPGWFPDPHAFITQELPWGFTAGLGFYGDYGLGSHYDNNWPLSFNSVETVFEGYCISPTISYKVTDKWSVAAGARFEHVIFHQRRIYQLDRLAHYAYGPNYLGRMRMKLNANNDFDVGYLVGTTYDITEDFSVGAVWRSRIRCDIEGNLTASGTAPYSMMMAAQNTKEVGEKLDLPMSATIGFNWDRALWLEKLHLSSSVTWTEWSTIDKLDLGVGEVMELGWHNAYRAGFGFEYDLADWITPGMGYVYDWDPTREKCPNTMLPAGDRHNIYFGATFHITDNLDFTLAGGMVLMESKTAWFDNPVTKEQDAFKFQSRNSHTYLASATITYHF
jgi:long-chain fatty acid transport protein